MRKQVNNRAINSAKSKQTDGRGAESRDARAGAPTIPARASAASARKDAICSGRIGSTPSQGGVGAGRAAAQHARVRRAVMAQRQQQHLQDRAPRRPRGAARADQERLRAVGRALDHPRDFVRSSGATVPETARRAIRGRTARWCGSPTTRNGKCLLARELQNERVGEDAANCARARCRCVPGAPRAPRSASQ